MTDIDIERLKTDRAYWDEVAPEGAEYFIRSKEGSAFPVEEFFAKTCTASSDVTMAGGVTVQGHTYAISFTHWHDAIPRPDPAWDGEGLPPVGSECESYFGRERCWARVEVLRHHPSGEGAAVYEPKSRLLDWCSQFRPLKSPEDRSVEAMIEHLSKEGGEGLSIEHICQALYRAGYRKTDETP